ncbi:hypothetical protein L226DRAFT_577119 [Lentinus tigrinus ALCF2SS1-7]|uniref:uncharacterized protein n=1 Tax=Lentinus tigrinus ALCF2SS1-7 TaxID=1328758 RepID=UPI001165E0DD|nr:hypothetical protein L226DRAFT_577119 [Lentinus tigrinus ALCF2SS1-7]
MGICHCDECKLWTYKDVDGIYRPGRANLDAATILGHAYAQRQKRKLATASKVRGVPAGEDEEGSTAADGRSPDEPSWAESTILLETLRDDTGGRPAVRPRETSVKEGSHTKVRHTLRPTCLTFERIVQRSTMPADEQGGKKDCPSAASAPPNIEDALIRERRAELGMLESSITLRSRVVSRFTKLRFCQLPATPVDRVGNLDPRHPGSAELLRHRAWLQVQLEELSALPNIGDKHTDRHLDIMISKFQEELARLDKLQSAAWQKEKTLKGLLFLDDPNAVPAPRRVDPRE